MSCCKSFSSVSFFFYTRLGILPSHVSKSWSISLWIIFLKDYFRKAYIKISNYHFGFRDLYFCICVCKKMSEMFVYHFFFPHNGGWYAPLCHASLLLHANLWHIMTLELIYFVSRCGEHCNCLKHCCEDASWCGHGRQNLGTATTLQSV